MLEFQSLLFHCGCVNKIPGIPLLFSYINIEVTLSFSLFQIKKIIHSILFISLDCRWFGLGLFMGYSRFSKRIFWCIFFERFWFITGFASPEIQMWSISAERNNRLVAKISLHCRAYFICVCLSQFSYHWNYIAAEPERCCFNVLLFIGKWNTHD